MHTLLRNISFFLAYFISHVLSQASLPTIQMKSYDQTDSVTTCSEGLRENVDNYIFYTNVSFQGTSAQWARSVIFEVSLQNNTQFSFLCQVDLDDGCAVATDKVCYCTSSINNTYNIVINKTATVDYCNGKIRGYLINSSSYHLESKAQQIPPIYASTSRQLTVNDVTLPSPNCPFPISQSNTVVKFCCNNSVAPCEVKILFNGNLVTSNNTCAYYTANTTLLYKNSNFTFKHAVCGGADEPTVHTCAPQIQSIPAEQTTTTLEPKITTFGTNKTKSDGSSTFFELKDWATALSVIFYAAIVLILGTGIALIIFALHDKTEGVLFKVCIGILVFDELLDIALIIAFSQTKPCLNDQGCGSNNMAMWQIMLTVFLVSNGALGIAAAVVAIRHFFCTKSKKLHENKRTDQETNHFENAKSQVTKTTSVENATIPNKKQNPLKNATKKNSKTLPEANGTNLNPQKTPVKNDNKQGPKATSVENGNKPEFRPLPNVKRGDGDNIDNKLSKGATKTSIDNVEMCDADKTSNKQLTDKNGGYTVNGDVETIFSNGAKGKGAGIAKSEMKDLNNTLNQLFTEESAANQADKTKDLRKKKKKKLKTKQINDFENGLLPSQPSSPLDYVIHSQAPSSTKFRPVSVEITTNPYIKQQGK